MLAVSARAIALVGCIGFGFSPWLAAAAARQAGLLGVPPPTAATLVTAVHAMVLSVVCDLAAFPLVVYSGWWLERRYRQRRRRIVAWLRECGRTMCLHVAVWSSCAVTVYALIQRWPAMWWLAAGGAFAVVTVALTHLGPVVLFPWLYELRPLDRPPLQARLDALMRRVGTPLIAVQEWRLGLDDARPSAALVGLGSTRRVLLSDALLVDYSDDEIEVVMAHELSHHVNHDVWKMIASETVIVVAASGAVHLVVGWIGAALGIAGLADIGGLPLLVIVGGTVVTVSAPVRNEMSRRHERRADQYALQLTENPAALASGLRRLAEQTLSEEQPSRLVEWFFYSHPPVADRLAAVRAAAEGVSR